MFILGSNSFSIALTVLAIMIAVGGMCLGIGYAMNNKQLKEFGRDELSQCIINGVLIGASVTLFLPSGIISSLINSATSGISAQCPSYLYTNSAICFSYAYLSGSGYTMSGISHASLLSQSTELIIGLFSLNGIFGLIGSLDVNILGIGVSLSQVMAPILYQLQFFIKALSTVAISILVQSSILSVISIISLTILLPLGIILRTFYPTRRLGGFVLGTMMGLYIVFPLTYVLNASILSTYSIEISNSTILNMTNSATSANSYLSGLGGLSTLTGTAISGLNNVISPIINAFSSFASTIMGYLSYLIMAVFVLPGFSIALTYISIKEFSSLFGSEINLSILDMV